MIDPSVWQERGAELDPHQIIASFGDAPGELRRLREEQPCVRRQGEGDALRVEGADGADLLHRIAATTLRDLPGGRCAPALFLDDKGRVIDLPTLCREEGAMLALTGASQSGRLKNWIERYTITEDVRSVGLEDATVLTLVGKDVLSRAADAMGLEQAPAPATFARATSGERLLGVDPHFSERGLLLVPTPARLADVLSALERHGVHRVGERAYRQWWIQEGRLGPGPELASGVNPLEAGLRDLVSWDKGCYIGQEVVARLDTYAKVKRRVVVVETEALVDPAVDLLDERGRKLGRVLTATPRLDAEGSVALALVDKDVENGRRVVFAEGGAGTVLVAAPASE